jgi:hypothetical protein
MMSNRIAEMFEDDGQPTVAPMSESERTVYALVTNQALETFLHNHAHNLTALGSVMGRGIQTIDIRITQITVCIDGVEVGNWEERP